MTKVPESVWSVVITATEHLRKMKYPHGDVDYDGWREVFMTVSHNAGLQRWEQL